ncbi:helix-turn-helix protein [Amycolatopsis sulphurea]|uniref:Helix-turn-helix protein n=1 Tax=Amycolatopsis sulphurea TaxID=76022 RepID=A0A2A9FBD9_9PSEU|nr:Scr1 family TA system antitoxin-like transcriptional regulator [Amycolatopsis sulphurea]PFG48091.1 helix-turn-helix protein [Amycolatopsis sulphurea]
MNTQRRNNILLGIALRAARQRRHWGLRELARRIGANQAYVSNWELGQRRARPETVARILGALGVTGEDARWLQHLAHTTHTGLIICGPDHPHYRAAVRDCTELSESIQVWHPHLIPDILQIPDYTMAVLRAQGVDTPTARRLTAARAESTTLITGGTTPITAYLTRAALTQQHLDTPTIMTRQLAHLESLTTTTNLTLRILPGHVALGFPGPFTRFSAYSAPIVHIPHHAEAGAVIPDQDGHYTAITDRLAKHATKHQPSLTAMRELISDDH